MRTYGRISNPNTPNGLPLVWQQVNTDANGFNDQIYITTLCQVLLLYLGESPFYANYGIPAVQSVLTQIFPDMYVALTQQQFSQYFANLVIAKVPGISPMYNIAVTTQQGVTLNPKVPIPT